MTVTSIQLIHHSASKPSPAYVPNESEFNKLEPIAMFLCGSPSKSYQHYPYENPPSFHKLQRSPLKLFIFVDSADLGF